MNPDQPSREQIEARLPALLLGELPASEAELLRWMISRDPELQKLHDQLATTIGFVREAIKNPTGAPTELETPLKLAHERRENLLAHFKTARPEPPLVPVLRRRFKVSPVIGVLAVIAIVALLAAILLPVLNTAQTRGYRASLTSSLEPPTTQQKASINNMRQIAAAVNEWQFETGQTSQPTTTPPQQGSIPPSSFAQIPPTPAGGEYAVSAGSLSDTPKLKSPGESTFTPSPSQVQIALPNMESSQTASEQYDTNVLSQNIVGYVNIIPGASSAEQEPVPAQPATPIAELAPPPSPAPETEPETASNVRVVEVSPGGSAVEPNSESPEARPHIGPNAETPSASPLALSTEPVSTPPRVPAQIPPTPADGGSTVSFGSAPMLVPTAQGGMAGSPSERNAANGKNVFGIENGISADPVTGQISNNALARVGEPNTASGFDWYLGQRAQNGPFANGLQNALAFATNGSPYFSGYNYRDLSLSDNVTNALTINQFNSRYAWSAKDLGLDAKRNQTLLATREIQNANTVSDNLHGVPYGPVNSVTEHQPTVAEVPSFGSVPATAALPVTPSSRSPQSQQQSAQNEQKIDGDRIMQAPKVVKQADIPMIPGLQPAPAPQPNAPIPQPEIQTSDNAFSTFSMNVSDVSFNLAMASLQKGRMPDPASIRSEEFINAFDYHDPEPLQGEPLAFTFERAQDPFAHERDMLRFSIKAAAAGRQDGRALNIVLLLDTSGSMERADRVAIIREALRVLSSQLHPQDIVSVVTFARTARLWADGIPGNEAGATLDKVGSITPEGGTNLEEATRLAYETALRHFIAGGINRVVLLTDGAANLGNVDPRALAQKVDAERRQGIALDCFGIGWDDYNDDLLEQLSSNGDGRYAFINSPEEAGTEFAAKLAGALQVAAEDVKVQVEFNPNRVTAWRQIGYAKHQLTKQQFRDNTVAAGAIAAREAGNALYVIETNPNGQGPIATVRVRYRVPGTQDNYEKSWLVDYTGDVPELAQSSPAMRLAVTAAEISEWMADSPFAQDVTPDDLLNYLRGVPQFYGNDERPKQLEWMIREAKSVSGK